MRSMNIVVLSGGSGNDALIKGLKSLYKESNVKVVVNAYDSGKSTGICRKVTNTLGVSDIRKNHTRMYKALTKNPDKRLLEFYDNRYDFTKGNESNEILALMDNWGLTTLSPFVVRFFERPESSSYEFKDFSVANIVYSQMYSEYGYEATNKFFCDMLGIDDFVILNSFDNVYLHAVLEDGTILSDEGDIVELKNPNNKIKSLMYVGDHSYGVNPAAVEAVLNADLLVISTGTFWSSIYPTIEYLDFYKFVNESKARKIWAINNEEDNDAFGVTSNDFIEQMTSTGLDLSEFTILENANAKETLRLANSKYDIVVASMDNVKGKHNGDKYATEILKIYYNLTGKYDRVIFDFDDTLWSRSMEESDIALSIENVQLVNDYFGENATIVSGNSYESIRKKLYRVFGTKLNGFNMPIWADANSTLYVEDKPVDMIEEMSIRDSYKKIQEFLLNFDIDAVINNEDFPVCLKIKPLNARERLLLSNYLNDYALSSIGASECVAVLTGVTTVDILNKNNNKSLVMDRLNSDGKTLYIGDEVDVGNDADIAVRCDNFVHTSGVAETNMLIKLLGRV